jgi:hypothetical protein
MKIDELVLSLVLDDAGLKKGQAATEAALVAIRSESEKTDKSMQAGAKKNAEAQKKQGDAIAKNSKETEKADKKTQDGAKNNTHSYGKWLASILSIGAAMVALNKFKNFAVDLTNSDAAAGRMAENIGMTTRELTAFGMTADKLGGSSEAMTADLFKLSQSIVALRAGGELPDWLTDPKGFFKLGGDLLPKLLDDSVSMLDKANMLQERMQTVSPQVRQYVASKLNISMGTANAWGDSRWQGQLATSRQFAPNDADAKLAQKRQVAWGVVENSLTSLGRGVTTKLSPAFLKVSDALVKFLSNKENLKAFQGIVDTIVNAVTGLFNIIDKAVSGIKQLLDLVTGNKAVDKGFLGNMLAILKAIADTINLIITGYKELGALVAPEEEDKSDFEKKADEAIYKAIDYVIAPFSESARERVGGFGGFGKDGKFRRAGAPSVANTAVPTPGQRVNSQNAGVTMVNSNNTTTTATINVKSPEQAGRAARSFNAPNRYAPANGMQ